MHLKCTFEHMSQGLASETRAFLHTPNEFTLIEGLRIENWAIGGG